MKLCLLYYSIMAMMYVVASKNKERFRFGTQVNEALTAIMYIIVFIMGIRMGSNEEVTANLGNIGIQATIISVLTIAFSMLSVTAMRKAMKIDKYGMKIAKCGNPSMQNSMPQGDGKDALTARAGIEAELEVDASEKNARDNKNKENLLTTLFITIDVIISMMIGYFVIRPMFSGRYELFESVTANGIVIGLCFLTGLVGLSLGLDGTIFMRMKEAGLKVLIVPLLMVTAAVAAGAAFALFSSFSMKEAVAISLGFGWYTYAPGVISEAGYVLAGAVSFLHNVIRETTGIILIPFIAQKIGYIECTTVPGVASMDICMPIIERSCNPETIVYGIANGFGASLACSLLVPLVISL